LQHKSKEISAGDGLLLHLQEPGTAVTAGKPFGRTLAPAMPAPKPPATTLGTTNKTMTKLSTAANNMPKNPTTAANNNTETGTPKLGLRFEKITDNKTATVCLQDLQALLQAIVDEDPQALLYSFNQKTFYKPEDIPNLTEEAAIKFVDCRNTAWGRASSYQSKTVFSFYVATDKLTKNKIHDLPPVKQYLQHSNSWLHYHTLQESLSAVVGYFQGKSPAITYRKDIEQRVKQHLEKHSINCPVQVSIIRPSINEYSTSMVALSAGKSDSHQIKQVLASHPITFLNLLPHDDKRLHPQSFEQELKNHDMLCQFSGGIKLQGLTQDDIEELREAATKSDVYQYIVDIPSSGTPGIAYVQLLKAHKDQVLPWVEAYLRQVTPKLDVVPSVVTTEGSMTAMTKQSLSTAATKPPPFKSRWEFDTSKAKPSPPPIVRPPKAITTNQGYLHAAKKAADKGNAKDDSSSQISSLSTKTRKTSNAGGGTTRDAELMDIIQDLRNQMKAMQAEMELLKANQAPSDASYHSNKKRNLQNTPTKLPRPTSMDDTAVADDSTDTTMEIEPAGIPPTTPTAAATSSGFTAATPAKGSSKEP